MGGISIIFLTGILSIFIISFFVVCFYLLFSYVFESIAIRKMSKDLGYRYSSCAWLPFYNQYILGKIASNKTLGGVLALINITSIVDIVYIYTQNLDNIYYFIYFLLSIFIGFIIKVILVEKIYKKYINNAILLTIFSILSFGILIPVFLFAIRDRKK